LGRAAEAVDARLLTLLGALGAEAVADDPGLVLRLRHQVGSLPALTAAQRRLLSRRLAPLEAGAAQGSGAGFERAGIARAGQITALLPSQLAYPWPLLAWRYRNGGLLYRTRTGRAPPRLRPTVIVLDVSPPCFGPVEGLTRPAAHALAHTLRRQGLPVVLVAAGGPPSVHLLEHPADLLVLLTRRTLASAAPAPTLATAQALRRHLAADGEEPLVLLLTQAWWGAEADAPPPSPLRALFVQYPGQCIEPPWASRCERWASLAHDQHARLPEVLGRLIG
jgi:hypothetical protein